MLLDGLEIYVGVLAATILFIATNAGVIGASRITYAMSGYRQLPLGFRRLHPRFKTPWIALVVFAGVIPILTILPGQTDFLGTMYSFGATLSFTVAHASIVALRYRQPDEELVYRARPNLRFRGVDWPLFAIVGGIGTLLAWIVIVVQDAQTRWAGMAWIALGFVGYAIYRRQTLKVPLTATVRAPVMVLGPSLTVEYRTIVVPVVRTAESEEALVAAARLASERGSRVAVVHVIEVPLDLPLDVQLPDAEAEADEILDQSTALVESYGIRAVARLLRARAAGPGDRRRGRTAERGARDPRRAATEVRARTDLRPHRRLRAQAQPLPRADRRRPQGRVSVALAWLMIALGVAVVVRTLAAGVGGGLGLVLGVLLVLAGGLRLYLHRARGL